MIDIAQLEARLREFDALRENDDIKIDTLDRIQPHYADEWPPELDQKVREALVRTGITKPYRHQSEAISKSLSGADIVLESPTASGKTLAFTAPMLHSLVQDRNSHALMIYPMKALAFDQREQIRNVGESLQIESWPYDGDTPNEHKNAMRASPPQILLTNPEYLNMSFLGWRQQWEGFLRSLRYVVIDEMHEYRGFFGGNMALLLRRFFLHLKRIGATPRIFLSTATCSNPAEHARNLTNREMEVISARNVFRPKRHFVFVNPAIPDYRYRDILQLRIEQAALTVLAEGLQTLVFCPTKRFLEAAFHNCRLKAERLGLDPKRITAFHADLKNEDRQDIQRKIKSGEIDVVFTTNALELGLDIGGLDAVILAGFPPSTMSAWQQIGRAGRGWDKDSMVLFYAMNDPIDRFFVGNLDAFLNKPFDELVVDPANEELIENHLASLVSETEGKLHPDDEAIIGEDFYETAQRNAGKPLKGYRPQMYLNMRGGIGPSFELKRGNEELGQISATRRFREAYIGAIFTFFGQKYRVHSHEEKAVVLTDAEPNLRTDPGFYSVLSQADVFDGFGFGDIEVYSGKLNIVMNFTGYKLVDENTGEVKDSGGTSDADFQNNRHAFWINVPQDASATAGIGALEHLIRVGAMFVIPADRFDTSTYSRLGDEPAAFYYENYRGGIGVAKKLFNVWQTALRKGVEIASQCGCRLGCQNCIEPAKSYDINYPNIDKVRGIELASKILATAEKGPDRRFQNGMMVPVELGLPDSLDRRRQADVALETIQALRGSISTGGRKFTRDEMNER